jgi:hypothetical protein
MSDDTYEWAGIDALTLPHRTMDREVVLRGKLPGAVIFLHGVNDPGACYETVETGLCQGLNERLGRNDLAPGQYGLEYQSVAAHAEDHVMAQWERDIYDNPDATLYARTEDQRTLSPFIPFYWGYRAGEHEISRDPDSGEPITLRGQNQHVEGHRLDYDFAREGGMFPNATNNIPDMYGNGFRATGTTDFVTEHALAGKGVYIKDAPPRRYFVLAAHRLAMLIRTMRTVQSRDPKKDPARETITIIAHSQGTLIALLAQALIAQRGERCADCLILVDSPYSVREVKPADGTPPDDLQTPYARTQTLIDIVNAVTAEPFALPALADLMVHAAAYEGRTGKRWQATHGLRSPKDGEGLVRFTERDNRGKVYCYFCPEDTVVGMAGVEGIGTFGVPDTVTEQWTSPRASFGTKHAPSPERATRTFPGMAGGLETMRFHQRMWTRLPQVDEAGTPRHVPVGGPPGPGFARTSAQGHRWAGPTGGLFAQAQHLAMDASHEVDRPLTINGEVLQPEHVPEMYGHEAIRGGIDAEGEDHAGQVASDRVGIDVALGNRYAAFLWLPVEATGDPRIEPDADAFKAGFNDEKHADDQTAHVRVVTQRLVGGATLYGLEREETPAEARARMPRDTTEFEANNYHSAILNHTENHRWVTAMDVALGQAVTLDDPVWRPLLMLMAGWRYTPKIMRDMADNANFDRLDDEAKRLIEATRLYFATGEFPGEDIIPMSLPALITSQTVRERRELGTAKLPDLRVPAGSTATGSNA